jgi:hypothetical protein
LHTEPQNTTAKAMLAELDASDDTIPVTVIPAKHVNR